MRLLRNWTIRERLTSIGILSSIAALVAASTAFLAFDLYTFRASLARRILTGAEIVAFNSVSPLLFDDAETATNTLLGLKAEPAVVAALIRREADGRPFASYARPGASAVDLSVP